MIKIMLIDDHPIFLDGLRFGIRSATSKPCQIDTCLSTNDALADADSLQQYDLILCDLNVPGMSGVEFIQKLVDKEIWVRVAIISASENDLDVHKALEAGAAGFIGKSMKLEKLIDAVDSILKGERFVPVSYSARMNGRKTGYENASMLPGNGQHLGLTMRQLEVLDLLTKGLTNREISDQLSVKESTVKSHVKVIFQTLDVSNRTACTLVAKSMNLVPEIPQYSA